METLYQKKKCVTNSNTKKYSIFKSSLSSSLKRRQATKKSIDEWNDLCLWQW